MKEIKIIGLKKSKSKYIIETETDEYNVDDDTVIKFQLFKDRIITENELNNALSYYHENLYFNKSLNYLSYKTRSVYEIEKYLQKYDLDENKINSIICRLKNLGYLDDLKFAEGYLDYCFRNNKGPNYFKNKLLEKKVKLSYIEKVLKKYDEETEKSIIENVVKKEARKLKTYPFTKQKQKIITKLIQNGFNYESILEIINKFSFVDESDERLTKDYHKLLSKYQKEDLNNYLIKQKIIKNLLSKGYEYEKILSKLE
ncbi:MAG TPA: hypothetical protein GXZ48_01460 [Acholeplasmataceae bacterium]|nr:hypothetical protein [Acholeplasmataceae bacterium]